MNFAVKTIAAVGLLTLSLASFAQASVQPVGTFVPQACGAQIIPSNQVSITEVCIGSIVAEPGQEAPVAFAFGYADGTDRVFEVKNTANFMIALKGNQTKSLFQMVGPNGEAHTMNVTRAASGKIESVSGELEGTQYYVENFEAVFVIQ